MTESVNEPSNRASPTPVSNSVASSSSSRSTISPNAFPKRVELLHSQACQPNDVQERLRAFYEIIDTSLDTMSTPNHESIKWISILNEIFDPPWKSTSKFFRDYGHDTPSIPDIPLNVYPGLQKPVLDTSTRPRPTYAGHFASTSIFSPMAPSYLLVDLIEHFGNRNGYSILLTVSQTYSSTVLQTITKVLSIISAHIPLWTEQFTKSYVPSLLTTIVQSLMRYLQTASIPPDVNYIESIFSSLSNLVTLQTRFHPTSNLPQAVDACHFNFAALLFTSSVFDQRISGLTHIIDIVRQITTPPNSETLMSDRQSTLAHMLTTTQFLKQLLALDTHIELLKQSSPIFRFALKTNSLSNERLADLCAWLLSSNPHSSITAQQLFLDLSDLFTQREFEVLFSKLIQIDSASISSKTLRFVSTMITKCQLDFLRQHKRQSGNGSASMLGLNMLWAVVEYENAESERSGNGLVHESENTDALSTLSKLLQSPLFVSERMEFAERCCSFLNDAQFVGQCICLLQAIINSYPTIPLPSTNQFPNGISSQFQFIHVLDQRYNLLTICFDLAMHFHESMNVNGRESPTMITSLNTAFSFLSSLLNLSSLALSADHLQRLYFSFICNSSSIAMQDSAYRFFKSLVEQRDVRVSGIPSGLLSWFFTNLLCHIPAHRTTVDGFECFRTYFIWINEINGNISKLDIRSSRLYDVHKLTLLGMDTLLSYVIDTENTAVVSEGLSLILRIFHQHKRSTLGKLGEMKIIQMCVSCIEIGGLANFSETFGNTKPTLSASESGSATPISDVSSSTQEAAALNTQQILPIINDSYFSSSSSLLPANGIDERARQMRITRCMNILLSMVTAESGLTLTESSETVGTSDDIQVLVTTVPDNKVHKLKLLFSDSTTLLRSLLSSIFSYPASYIELIGTTTNTNRVIPDDIRLGSLCANPQTRSVSLGARLKAISDELLILDSIREDSAAHLLSRDNSSYYRFYDFMDSDQPLELVKAAYELLSKLPVNPRQHKTIVQRMSAWEKLIPIQSPLQFLHALKIVKSIITPQKFEPESLQLHRQAWLRDFIGTGGIEHLRNAYCNGLSRSPNETSWLTIMRTYTLGVVSEVFLIISQTVPEACTVVFDKASFSLLGIRTLTGIKDCLSTIENASRGDVDFSLGAEALGQLFSFVITLMVRIDPSTDQTISLEDMYHELWWDSLLNVMMRHDSQAIRVSFCKIFFKFVMKLPNEGISHEATLFTQIVNRTFVLINQIHNHPKSCLEYLELINCMLSIPTIASSASLSSDDALHTHLAGFKTDSVPKSIILKASLVGSIGETLLKNLVSELQIHVSAETSRDSTDLVLRGLLILIEKAVSANGTLAQRNSSELVQAILSECLFALDPNACEIKSKALSPTTRSEAFSTLHSIMLNNESACVELLRQFITFYNHPRLSGRIWDVEGNDRRHNFVGLRNLGSTCYMNSLMQQLVMIPNFAEQLLQIAATNNSQRAPSIAGQNEISYEGEQLFELQRVLLHLVASFDPTYDPSAFVQNFSFYGERVNVSQQMDALEFLSSFMDHLEESLSRTNSPSILKSFLGGTVRNSYNCLPCGHIYSRPEPFYALSLSVHKDSSIEVGLNEYTASEVMSGPNAYLCSTCNKKVETERYSAIDTLPNILIFHLKRFEFDFQTGTKKKLNYQCTFPTSLNMFPYTADYIQENRSRSLPDGKNTSSLEGQISGSQYFDGCWYRLIGVLVHSGDASGGHYYSYIADRSSFVASEMPPDTNSTRGQHSEYSKWVEFNDTSVRPFDFNNLKDECFGGFDSVNLATPRTNSLHQAKEIVTLEKTRSAYLLFYEKIDSIGLPSDYVLVNKSGFERVEAADHEYISCDDQVADSSPDIARLPPSRLRLLQLPAYLHSLRDSVLSSNFQYLCDQLYFDPANFTFMIKLYTSLLQNSQADTSYPDLDSLSLPMNLNMLMAQSLTYFVFNVVCHAKQIRKIESYFALLQRVFSNSVPACYWLLTYISQEENAGLLQQLLIDCPTLSIRQLVAVLINFVISCLMCYEIDENPNALPPLLPMSSESNGKAFSKPPPSATFKYIQTNGVAPPTPAKKSQFVDVSLAPPNMFNRTTGKVTLHSSVSILKNVSAPIAKSLMSGSILTIAQLEAARDLNAKQITTLLQNCRLEKQKLLNLINDAIAACHFIRQHDGSNANEDPSISASTSNAHFASSASKLANNHPKRAIIIFMKACCLFITNRSVTSDFFTSTDAVFFILSQFSQSSASSARILVENNLVPTLINLIIKLPEISGNSVSILRLLAHLLRVCIIPPSSSLSPFSFPSANACTLTPATVQSLLTAQFANQLVGLLPLRSNDPIIIAPALLCWCNKSFSEIFFDAIIAMVNIGDVGEIWNSILMLENVLKLSDTVSLQIYRMDYVLPALLSLMESNQRYYKVTHFCICWLINFALANQAVRNWISTHQEHSHWISKWLSSNPKPPKQSSSRSSRQYPVVHDVHVTQADRLHKVDPPKVLEESWMSISSNSDPLKSWLKVIM